MRLPQCKWIWPITYTVEPELTECDRFWELGQTWVKKNAWINMKTQHAWTALEDDTFMTYTERCERKFWNGRALTAYQRRGLWSASSLMGENCTKPDQQEVGPAIITTKLQILSLSDSAAVQDGIYGNTRFHKVQALWALLWDLPVTNAQQVVRPSK